MRRFGVAVVRERDDLVQAHSRRRPMRVRELLSVEGDASSASYFLAAGAIVRRTGAHSRASARSSSIQGDVGFAETAVGNGTPTSAAATIGSRCAARQPTARIDADFNRDSYDAAMTAAMVALSREASDLAAQYRQLASEGNRSHRQR